MDKVPAFSSVDQIKNSSAALNEIKQAGRFSVKNRDYAVVESDNGTRFAPVGKSFVANLRNFFQKDSIIKNVRNNFSLSALFGKIRSVSSKSETKQLNKILVAESVKGNIDKTAVSSSTPVSRPPVVELSGKPPLIFKNKAALNDYVNADNGIHREERKKDIAGRLIQIGYDNDKLRSGHNLAYGKKESRIPNFIRDFFSRIKNGSTESLSNQIKNSMDDKFLDRTQRNAVPLINQRLAVKPTLVTEQDVIKAFITDDIVGDTGSVKSGLRKIALSSENSALNDLIFNSDNIKVQDEDILFGNIDSPYLKNKIIPIQDDKSAYAAQKAQIAELLQRPGTSFSNLGELVALINEDNAAKKEAADTAFAISLLNRTALTNDRAAKLLAKTNLETRLTFDRDTKQFFATPPVANEEVGLNNNLLQPLTTASNNTSHAQTVPTISINNGDAGLFDNNVTDLNDANDGNFNN
ncbi:MAG: hypothetical protein IT497_02015 [Ottowia sp.]|nr:hypothetical protein [Ottowia sp.]